MSSPTPGFNDVIIVGVGPSGLLLALMLAQSSIPVTLLDMKSDLDKNPRATHYPAASMHELNRGGVGDDLRERGFMPAGLTWRKLDGTPIVTLDAGNVADDPDRMVCLPLDQLGEILRKHLLKHQNVKIMFDYEVTGIGQNEDKAWVVAETPDGEKKLSADYIVGCDGANSQIRRSLFGDSEFPGRTWDEQIVATNFKWNDSNFIVHPEHYFMAAKIIKDGLWRVSYGELPGLTFEQLRERQPTKFRDMLPGHPSPSDYKLVNFSPYKVHQRLATSIRQGRFLLAADAAHLCNPFGGLGLTGGIVDVGGLYDCLRGMYENKADATILDKYNEVRRQKWLDVIDVVSSSNLRRLFETDDFFQMLKKAETDPAYSQELQNAVKAIEHDFTQYYK
ncbi:FAD-binding-3 domain-containing protein [Fusarium sp. LHS14.1]|nr:FAD-binding-3 domain-containing protein [Fusarium sp. LHS14.1]